MSRIATLTRTGAFQRQLKHFGIAAVICAVLVAISIGYVDRPVARYAFTHRAFAVGYEIMATPSLLSLPFANIYLPIFAFAALSGRPWRRHTSLCLTLSVAIDSANGTKDLLKWLIGRPWPAEWYNSGVYHLEPFTDSSAFGSFPSGHTTYIAAPMFVLFWRLPPKYRPIWMALIAVVMIGLVGYGFHFVGDVIAGFFLGMVAAAASVALIRKTPPHGLEPQR